MTRNYINDEVVEKYFDRIYYIPHFSEKKLNKLVDPIIEKAIANIELSEPQRETMLKERKEENTSILANLKNSLTSIRKIIKFSQVLKENLKKTKNDIFLPDIVIMSIIEATDLRTFDFIRRYKENLSLHPISKDAEEIITGIQFERLKNFCSFAREENYLNNYNEDTIYYLFPHIEIALKYNDEEDYSSNLYSFNIAYHDVYETAIVQKRISLDLLLTLFFAPNEIDITISTIINQDNKDRILSKLLVPQLNPKKGKKLLEQFFPSGDYNRDLRNYSNIWLKRIIQNDNNHNLCVNILISLSFVIKDKNIDLGIEEKYSLANLVWIYLERHDIIDKQQTLIKLVKLEDNSDVFSNLILHKIITNDNSRIPLDEDLKISIAKKFLSRINAKLQKIEQNEERSVFNTKYFDDTISTIWRWYEAAQFLKDKKKELHLAIDLATHIDDFLSNSPDNFELLFRSSFNDFYWAPFDKIAFVPDGIFKIITEDLVTKLVQKYLDNGKYISFDEDKINALKEWLENNNLNNKV